MRILVNYDPAEQNHLPVLQYHLRARNLEAIATSSTLTISELLNKAKAAKCEGVLLCNSGTLANLVPGESPTLDQYRGSRLNYSVPVIVCNSLAHCHTVDHGAWLLGRDLDKFKQINIPPTPFSFTVLETRAQMEAAFSILSQALFISYDIETKTVNEIEDEENDIYIAGDTFITCCSWTAVTPNLEFVTFVLPLVDFLEIHWKNDLDHEYALTYLRRVNALPQAKAMHNGMYDALHSIVYHAEPVNWTLDTMAMGWCEYSSLPKTLDFIASITCYDYIQWETEATTSSKNKDIQAYWQYNAKDTWYTARIALYYLRSLPAYARKNYGIQFKLVYPFLYCNFEGILINQDARKKMRAERLEQIARSLQELRLMFGDPKFNPGSPKQVQFYIYDIFGATDPKIGWKKVNGKKIKKTRGTDEKNLKAVGEQHPLLLRIVDAILSYREASKAVSTYFDFKQKNGRLLWNINPFGTDTGRASAQSSSFWCGTQVQNQPPYAKEMLEADPDYELIEADNSQSEARCTAYLSKETRLIAALEDPHKDFYKSLGTLFFGIPYDQVTKEFRNAILKKIVHGTNYMMGAATFVENAGAQNLINASGPLNVQITLSPKPKAGEITIKQFGSQLLESYHKPFPRVREWYSEVKNEIATTHMLKSPLGWTRYFFGDILKTHQIFSSAVAHGPQNLSVCVLNIGLWKAWQLVKKEKGAFRLKAQIHDSIFAQVKKDRPELKQQMLACMDNPVMIHGRSLKIPVDYKDGVSWGNMIEHK